MIFLRSLVFVIAQIIVTPPYAIVAIATFPLPRLARYRVISGWSHAMIWLAQKVLGIQYRVIGAENLPRTPAVILSKHQSAWETLAFQVIFPPQVWVLKRELLWIPFFGWYAWKGRMDPMLYAREVYCTAASCQRWWSVTQTWQTRKRPVMVSPLYLHSESTRSKRIPALS